MGAVAGVPGGPPAGAARAGLLATGFKSPLEQLAEVEMGKRLEA